LQSIFLRHPEVHDKDVGRMLIIELAGFLSIGGFSHNLDVL
jgi:hypothetical protein